MIDVESLFEARWLEGGRDWPNVDCYGIGLHLRKLRGLPDWPRFDNVTRENDGLHIEGLQFLEGTQIGPPVEDAVACCYTGQLMRHIGFVINTVNGLMVVECNPKTNVSVMPPRRFERRFARVEYHL